MNNIEFAIRRDSAAFRRWCKEHKISKGFMAMFKNEVWETFCMYMGDSVFLYYPTYKNTIWIGGYFLARKDNLSVNKFVSGIAHETLHAVLHKIDEPNASTALDNFVFVETLCRTGLSRRLLPK